MSKYEPYVYDMVTIRSINKSKVFEELELVEGNEYMVTYVFADGSCILYSEHEDVNEGTMTICEYIVESESVKYLSLLSRERDNGFELFEEELLIDFPDDSETKYTEDINYDEVKNNIDSMLDMLISKNMKNNCDLAMDIALANDNYEKAQEIYNIFYKKID